MTSAATADLAPYDAVVVLSFGGPEAPEEVIPFLRHVTAGRGIPETRLADVAEHYFARGGISPINAHNRALVEALGGELTARGIAVPIRLANRHSAPWLADTVRDLYAAGAARLLVVLTSGYSSYSSCRQYREALAEAIAQTAPGGDLVAETLTPWFATSGFVAATAEGAVAALHGADPRTTRVLYVTHSIPVAMADKSGPPSAPGQYVAQHRRVADGVDARIAGGLGRRFGSELVFCSRSGRPGQAWLEPDVSDRIRELAGEGIDKVVLVPIGFTSDHMEVVSDLDTDAVATGEQVGVEVVRTPTAGTHPAFVAGLVDLLLARAASARGDIRAAAASPLCGDSCCPNPRPTP